MAGVFLSYDRDDAAKARPIALALEKAGHSVWWDLHVRGGAQFAKVIEEALKAADAVVVLWSKDSVDSPWVRDEAAAGRDSGRLIPVSLDGTEPPLGFRQFQTVDFARWKGRGTPGGFDVLLQSIAALSSNVSPARSVQPVSVAAGPQLRFPVRAFVLGLAALATVGAAIGLIAWAPWAKSRIATVSIRAGDSSAASQALARDLLVQLGALRPVLSNSMRLVNEASGGSEKPDLQFQSAATADGKSAGANLVLLDGSDEVLWSKQFEDSQNKPADFRQQIAFTAARVLRCAIDESSGKYGRLASDLRLAFLDACAASTEIGWDTRTLVAPLRKVITASPRFRPAWALLLNAEVNAVTFAAGTPEAGEIMGKMKADVAAARRIYPDMAEVTVGEYTSAPNLDLPRSVELMDKAKSQDPDNPFVLREHSILMASVGRVRESVDDAQRAAQLDPLSPATVSDYIRALTYAGQVDAARAELEKAKRLWPGTQTVQQAEYSIDLRYGDFEKAMLGSGENHGVGARLYIAARKDPSDANVRRFMDYARNDTDMAGLVFASQAFGEMNRVNELYQFLASVPLESVFKGNTYALFRPWLAGARRDRRFMVIAKRTGLLTYWRKSGNWPDFCSEPDLPYDCKKEAARLNA